MSSKFTPLGLRRALPFLFFLRVLLLAAQLGAQMRPSISICGVKDLVHRCG